MHQRPTKPHPHEPSSRFPRELEAFLSRPTYSLLIKGASGTGKTILALTILGSLKKSESILYISTRNSPVELLKDYPWTRKLFGAGSEAPGRPEGEAKSWETLVDARLDESGTVFERITNILMDKQAPTVVLDSWESLDDSVDKDALRTNIRVLQTWRERAGARFIFISQDATNATIDPIVEGVVVLSEQVFQGRRLREITLAKLHGVQISRPSYFLSLEGGIFHSFDRSRLDEFGLGRDVTTKTAEETTDIGRYRTGFKDLDETLGGGYQAKSVVWIEVEQRVDSRVPVAFMSGMIRQWAASGKSVVVQKSEGIDQEYIGQIRSSLGGRGGERIMVWGSASLEKWKELYKGIRNDSSGSGAGQSESRQLLSVVDWDKITRSGVPLGPTGGMMPAEAEAAINFLKGSAELTILLTRSNPGQQALAGPVSAHIKIVEINGTLFALSEKPWSELYAITTARRGTGAIELERVV